MSAAARAAMRLAAFAACWAVGACARTDASRVARRQTTAAPQFCTDGPLPLITARGVGPVAVGARMAELAAICPVSDSSFARGALLREDISAVRFGEHAVLAIAVGGFENVARVEVRDAAFRTERGVGVGSTAGELRARYGAFRVRARRGSVILESAAAPGLSFAMTGATPTAGGTELSDDALVSAVWVTTTDDPLARSVPTP
ncbi:MAG: hypothetical protein ABJD07_06455 [Gemmatimonadaceae bacterium]